MLKKLSFALAAILSVSLLASCVINADDDDDKSGVDYTDHISGSYSIKVKNEYSGKVVCFCGEPSEESLISGAIGGGKTTGLAKPSTIFKDSSFDFTLYVITEENYEKYKSDYKTMAQNPLCRLYAFYNADAQAQANLIYTISDKLGGEFYFQLNNTTKYNCEIRKDGLYGEPFCYAGAQTLKTIIYAQEGDYDFYPVFRKFDKTSGAILTNYPKTAKGNPMYVAIGLGTGEEAAKIDCKDFFTSDFTIAASATYLQINNTSKSGVKLYKGANAIASVTDTGIATINSGKKATFTIALDRVSGTESDVKYESQVTIGGWKVGPEANSIDIPTETLLGGERYTLIVSGASYDDLSCAYDKKDGELVHYTMNLDD